ncbi:hypothetical protein HA050_18575 [Iodobacter sp. HSC-16F04]|uniref:Uncharacterized protein n=2 Tax=Iodobacter violaceini TaxID=3044271 RepID=A0ABX0KTV7_9NEIS|nr:hypothetical protein [Iodobacter violacea]
MQALVSLPNQALTLIDCIFLKIVSLLLHHFVSVCAAARGRTIPATPLPVNTLVAIKYKKQGKRLILKQSNKQETLTRCYLTGSAHTQNLAAQSKQAALKAACFNFQRFIRLNQQVFGASRPKS